jgi:riboflavin kinase/FMN adenylyltransferase
MSIANELFGITPKRGMLLTIGVFDGVHLGHRQLLSILVEQAKQQELISGVITFKQHPQKVLRPGGNTPFLTNLTEKTKLLKDEGVGVVIPLSFTLELAQTSTGPFTDLLIEHLKMRGLVLGPDFALARNREGDIDALRALGQRLGFGLTVVPEAKINGEVVSSTSVRNALTVGDMNKVCRMLGRYYSLEGSVVSGVGRGAKMGFPTANLDVEPERALPADGIYATLAYIDGQRRPSVTNIGRRPTFGESERTVEVYILDFSGDLYRRQLKIDIIEKLRPEKKFDTTEQLEQQIAQDVTRASVLLDRLGDT